MSVVQAPPEQRFLLRNVRWETYRRLLEEQGDRPIRLTYDRGELEFMTLSFGHERRSRHLNRLIEALAEELELPIVSAGSTTLNREDVDRGLEPDECYYLRNEPRVRGKDEIDLAEDPPPDLAVEIDVSRSSLDRLSIYAALGVPEVWRYDGERLIVYHRRADGTFSEQASSLNFPFLPMAGVARLLSEAGTRDQLGWLRSVRAWIRTDVIPLRAGGPDPQ